MSKLIGSSSAPSGVIVAGSIQRPQPIPVAPQDEEPAPAKVVARSQVGRWGDGPVTRSCLDVCCRTRSYDVVTDVRRPHARFRELLRKGFR